MRIQESQRSQSRSQIWWPVTLKMVKYRCNFCNDGSCHGSGVVQGILRQPNIISTEGFEGIGDTPWPHIDRSARQPIVYRPNAIEVQGTDAIFGHHGMNKARSLNRYIGCWISQPASKNIIDIRDYNLVAFPLFGRKWTFGRTQRTLP